MRQNKIKKESKAAQLDHLGNGETILLADDNAQLRTAICMYLSDDNYKIIEAGNGAEAVTKYIENRDKIDMLLLDVMMPVKNGKEAYEEIKKLTPTIKTVFMSGYTDNALLNQGILMSGLDFIPKPANPDVLMTKIREILSK